MLNFSKKAYFLTTLFSTFLLSQSLDREFLESLPSEVSSDLVDQIVIKEDSQKTQYRRPSTFINKPSIESNRFGINFFSMMQSTFMPLNEPNFDDSYILDYGDVLQIQLVGQKSSKFNLPIERDGSVSVPDLGKFFISGLSLNEVTKLLKTQLESSYIGTEVFLTLVSVRDIQIIISGNAYNPGPYTLNGNSNLFHALSVSGGPSEIGSFREIELIRENKVIDIIDLYQIFIFGKADFGERLRSGDIVFIKPAKNLVNISGAVKRPANYELTFDETLEDLLFFSNGLTNAADLSNMRLDSLNNGSVEITSIESIENLSEIVPDDGDSLYIRAFPYRRVNISGAVTNPGSYILNEGDGILDLVTRAGGYTSTAYPFGGVLENERIKDINQIAIDELYKTLFNRLLAAKTPSEASAISGIMDELSNSEASGRINAEFNLNKLITNPDLDHQLQDGDQVIIPELVNQVYIFGEVANEGTIQFFDGAGIEFYIERKGGYNSYADKKNIFVLNPNGVTTKINKNVFMSEKRDLTIYPGSIIFVPRKINNSFIVSETAQAYATILSNLGVTLASVAVLKD